MNIFSAQTKLLIADQDLAVTDSSSRVANPLKIFWVRFTNFFSEMTRYMPIKPGDIFFV